MSVKDRLCQHYSSVGIKPKEAARFSSLVSKWIDESGPQWTVDRLKSLAAAYKSHLQSPEEPYPLPEGWATRVNRKGNKILKDGLAHSMMSCTSGKSLVLAQAFFRSHQVIKTDVLLKAQVQKFVDGISKPLPATDDCQKNLAKVKTIVKFSDGVKIPKRRNSEVFFSPLSHWPMGKEKRSPVYELDHRGRLESLTSCSRTDIRTKNYTEILCSDIALNGLWKDFPAEVSRTLTGSESVPYMHYSDKSDLPAGKIGFIPEPGMKLRCVANPSLAVQALGEPLKRKLELLSQAMPNVYTFDQTSGQQRIVEWLREGRKVWSFDASAFTDRFPYTLQRTVMERLIREGWADSFDLRVLDAIVAKEWVLPKSAIDLGFNQCVRWEVGQPMGFGPSFHVATVSHDLVVQSLGSLIDAEIGDAYVIVGDDIAISNEELAISYSQFMTSVGVEINMTKSMVSASFAEFCGKLITPHGVSDSIKTREITSQDQLISTLDFYGQKGFNYLNEREQAWAVKAILPVEMGGLGYSPIGCTYREYLSILRLDVIQQRFLLNELDRFFEVPTSETVQQTLDSISKFYDENDVGLSESEWVKLIGDDNLALSAWTGLPVMQSQPGDDNNQECYYSADEVNTYRYLYDNAVRQMLSQLSNPDVSKRPDVNDLLEVTRVITDPIVGYINKREKPPMRPITVIGNDQNERKQDFRGSKYLDISAFDLNPSGGEISSFEQRIKAEIKRKQEIGPGTPEP